MSHSPALPARAQAGISLIEILMALAITALVMLPVLTMLESSAKAGTVSARRAVLEQDLQFALERVASAARATPRKVLAPQNSALADSGNWFDQSRFRVGANGQLLEVRGGVDNIVAESVTAFSVSARTAGVEATMIEATLRLERDGDSAQGSIALRMGGPRW